MTDKYKNRPRDPIGYILFALQQFNRDGPYDSYDNPSLPMVPSETVLLHKAGYRIERLP